MLIVDRFDGPEQALLLVAIVGLVGTLLTVGGVVVTAIIANSAKKHSQVIREQVENDHKDAKNPNLRADLDDKHDEQKKQLDKLGRGQDRLITDVHAMRDDIGLLKQGWRTNRDDIDDLMDTAAQERRQREMWGPPPATRRERRDRDDAR